MTPVEVLLTAIVAVVALCAGYALVMWLAEGVVEAIEFMSQYE